MLKLFIALIISYFIGAIPTAYIFARYIKRIDIRDFGSGNVGATNVYRIVGKVPAFIVLFIDIVKGFIPVVILPVLFDINIGNPELVRILIGIACISGHVWTVFLKFKGGKGVATTAGVLLAIMPKVLLMSFLVWLVVFLIFRYVSLASIASAISLPIAALIMNKPLSIIIFSVTLCIIGSYNHKSNIVRLIRKEEKRLF